ncbi:MAG: OmpA family protein [Bacteroidota bacterium]
MQKTILTTILVSLWLLPGIMIGQTDVEGSEDHPLLTRYPGSYISYYETVKFREYSFATGPVTGYRHIEEKQNIEGQLTRITYYVDKHVDDLSISEVYRDYAQAIEKAGITVLAKGGNPQRNVDKQVGGSGWIGLALGANSFRQGAAANFLFAGTSSSGGTFAVMGRVDRPEGPTYLALYGERHSKDLVICHLDVLEVKGAETGNVFADADFISKAIADRGSVVIYGITFDFDKSTIKPESKSTLDEIAKYLTDNPSISLYVVGHTDMKGSLEYNLRLSKARAKAVVDAMVNEYGIKASRLASDGVAFLSPKATNISDEGRAMNRRTELVRRVE